MKSEPLLILVTCIEGMDEWRDVWGFDPREIVAFIRKGTIVKMSLNDVLQLSPTDIQNHIGNDDVWVINGRYVTHQGFQQWIQTIPWSNLGREVRIKVHRGGGRSIKDSDFQQTRRALGKFLEGAQDYSLGGQIDPNHPVVRFARYINNGNPNDNWSNYDNELAQLRNFFQLPYVSLSILKHKILNLLTPLQIDIEGLIEKNFDENYWEQVVKAHKNLSQEFQNVKNLIYSPSTSKESEPETIEDIISKITDEETKSYLTPLWKKVKELLPKLTGDDNVNSLLDAIEKGNKNEFKRIITLHGNVYKKWMDELIGAIEQIILELQTKQ